ncbi:ABC transporter substrate-binding protein [Microbacterium terrisoli]|uniref:ABC transporter substrate-binding protein n=1 Tax=Microbacterium terrisoli TaxID=3242192 RepID=UPI00280630A2|nr:ABC transporter substrate-binding protein [Microbacterium protaetiae]
MSTPTRVKHLTKRALIALTIGVTASMALAACTPAPTATQATIDSSNVALENTGAEVDQVTVALPGSLSNLYPGIEDGILNYNVIASVQEGLVGRDASGKMVGALATSWTTPDATTYVFELRKDAKFQNGDPVTADDVAFSIKEAADAKASPGTYYYLQNMASVAVTGPEEVTVKTKHADAGFLVNMSIAGAIAVTQKKFWQAHNGKIGTSQSLIMGTGPYKVTEFVPDSHVTLERVDTWWGGVPKVKKIVFQFIPDQNTRLAAAQKGDVDIALNVPIPQLKQWQGISNSRIEAVNDLSYVGMIFDQKVKPFDDINVRKAISYSIDRNAIVKNLLRGLGQPASAIMTPESLEPAYSADAAKKLLGTLPQYDFDMAKAKAALAASSVPNGFTTELTYPNTGPQIGLAAQAIAESLKTIGVTVKVSEVPIEQWLATIGDGKHGLGFMWYFSTTGDPSEINSYLVGPDNPNNFTDPTAADIITKSSAQTDPKTRIDDLMQLEKLSADNAVNAPIWWGKSVTYFSNKIGIDAYSPYTFVTMWGSQLFAAKVK